MSSSLPTSAGPSARGCSTLRMNPYVRCVPPNGGVPEIRSLKELLSVTPCGGDGRRISPAEADTPCLGPTRPHSPHHEDSSTHSRGGRSASQHHLSSSPQLTFTVDSVATPNTFAHQQKMLQVAASTHTSELLSDDDDIAMLPTSTTDVCDSNAVLGSVLPRMDVQESVQNERIVSPGSHSASGRPCQFPVLPPLEMTTSRQEEDDDDDDDERRRNSKSAPSLHADPETRRGMKHASSDTELYANGPNAHMHHRVIVKQPVAKLEESPYHYIMRNFCGGTFLYYSNAESKQYFLDLCHRVLREVRPILETETISPAHGLFPAIHAPAFVLGDIHGNFADLSFFLQRILVFHDFNLTPSNLVFLGDYVDRGDFSVECVLLLLSLKIMNPNKVVLLRGNHEDRVVCGDIQTYGRGSFKAQCQTIFGYREGNRLFMEITDLFRYFPLAAELIIPSAPNRGTGSNCRKGPARRGSMGSGGAVHHSQQSHSDGATRDLHNNLYVSQATVPIEGDSPDASKTHGGGVASQRQSGQAHVDAHDNIHSGGGGGPHGGGIPSRFYSGRGAASSTHEERILCTHGGIPRFSRPPLEEGSLEYLRTLAFPRLVTIFPNNSVAQADAACAPHSFVTSELPRLRDTYPEHFAEALDDPVNDAGEHPLSDEDAFHKAWFIMMDLMWSDPTPAERDVASDAQQMVSAPHVNINEWGFGINTRGSSVVSFSALAVETFLSAYGYSMLFRAHQEKAHGLRWSKKNRVLTVFSSSNYLGHGNGAGCVVVSTTGEVQMIEKMGC